MWTECQLLNIECQLLCRLNIIIIIQLYLDTVKSGTAVPFRVCTHIYTIICLKSVCRSTFADCRSQFLLDRLGRCLKLIVSYLGTSSPEFASQFGLAFFYTRKTSINYHECRVSRIWLLNGPATPITMRSRLNRYRPVGAATTAVMQRKINESKWRQ